MREGERGKGKAHKPNDPNQKHISVIACIPAMTAHAKDMQRSQDTGNKRVGKHLCRRPCPFVLPTAIASNGEPRLDVVFSARGGRAEQVEGNQQHEWQVPSVPAMHARRGYCCRDSRRRQPPACVGAVDKHRERDAEEEEVHCAVCVFALWFWVLCGWGGAVGLWRERWDGTFRQTLDERAGDG